MKNIFLNLTVCLGLIAPMAQAKSIFDEAKSGVERAKQKTQAAWEQTKGKVQSGYQKTSAKFADLHNKALTSWNNISPQSKDQIKQALTAAGAIAGAAAVAGAGYAASSYYDKSKNAGSMYPSEKDPQVLNQLIAFLSTDPQYKGKPELQKTFLKNRLTDASDYAIQNILNLVEYEERPSN